MEPNDQRLVDLRKDGLLWLINRIVFHPRGYALACDDENHFFLIGDGSEPWRFTPIDENPDGGIDENALFAKVKELMP